jgi:hypothetical protein
MLLWLAAPRDERSPFGEAIVSSIESLGVGESVLEVATELRARLNRVADHYNTRASSENANSKLAKYAAWAAAGQLVVIGDYSERPFNL